MRSKKLLTDTIRPDKVYNDFHNVYPLVDSTTTVSLEKSKTVTIIASTEISSRRSQLRLAVPLSRNPLESPVSACIPVEFSVIHTHGPTLSIIVNREVLCKH